MNLPVTIQDRYAWGDIEGLLWAREQGRIPALPEEAEAHFAWKLHGTRELYEQLIAISAGPRPGEAEAQHATEKDQMRTAWARSIFREFRPTSLLDFGAWLGAQAAAFAEDIDGPVQAHDLCGAAVREGRRYTDAHLDGRLRWSSGGADNLPAEIFDAINAQEVLEHVFDLDATLEALATRARPGTIFCVSFPWGPWEAQHEGVDSRGHVRLVLPEDCRELFARHDMIALHALAAGPTLGWTVCAFRYRGGGFGKIDFARHWERLG